MGFEGKTLWITGASSGIGEALAASFARRGARLLLSARRIERLEAVRAALPGGERHEVLALDLAAADTLPAIAAEVLRRLGRLDVVVHNAGISQRSLARDTGLEVDRRIFEVNFFGTVALTKAVLPSMIEGGGGHFVVVTSLVGKIATPVRSAYSASKHALHGFFDALRAEEHEHGIRVTLACPGFVRTELSFHALTGTGAPQGTMDRAQEHGLAPEVCAEAIVRAAEKGKREVLIGGRERWAVTLHRFLPGLYHRFIRTARVT